MPYKTIIKNRKELNVEEWNHFIDLSPHYTIYAKSFYLDALHPNWKGLYCYHNDRLLAVMPLCVKSILGFKWIVKPSWIQYLGIFFRPINEKRHRYYFLLKMAIQSMCEVIGKNADFFNYNFVPSFQYHIPFIWRNFNVTPCHSYHLDLAGSIEELYANFSTSVTNHIRRAQKLKLNVVENNSISELIQILSERNIIDKNQCRSLNKLWDVLVVNSTCFTIYIQNPKDNKIYCGGAFIVDKESIIFLASGMNSQFKSCGAVSLMIWSVIQKAKSMGNITKIDFEGSMTPSIENYFRSFNCNAIVYYNIQKKNYFLSSLKYLADKSRFLLH